MKLIVHLAMALVCLISLPTAHSSTIRYTADLEGGTIDHPLGIQIKVPEIFKFALNDDMGLPEGFSEDGVYTTGAVFPFRDPYTGMSGELPVVIYVAFHGCFPACYDYDWMTGEFALYPFKRSLIYLEADFFVQDINPSFGAGSAAIVAQDTWVTATANPEPSTVALGLSGLLLFGIRALGKRKGRV